jgi:hypothetical protein
MLLCVFPVVPDVLDIVVIFYDVDAIISQRNMRRGLQLLVVLRDQRGRIPVFRTRFIIEGQQIPSSAESIAWFNAVFRAPG